MVDFLLLFNQVLTRHDGYEVLVVGFSHGDDLIWLSCLGWKQLDRNLAELFKCLVVEHVDFIDFGHKNSVILVQVQSHGAFKILLNDRHLKVMGELSPVDSESPLVGFIRDTVSDFRAKHHLITSHKVGHDVFKRRLKGLGVNEIEVYLIIASDLDPLVSFDEENESSGLYLVVLLPSPDDIPVLVFLLLNLEEDNFARASGNECFVVDKIHLPKVHFGHPFVSNFLGVVTIDVKGLSLPVERVDHIFVWIVKALVWKVLRGAFQDR